MSRIAQSSKPILQALLLTALSVLAFFGLAKAGCPADLSLFASLVLAGVLNIGRMASLNSEQLLLTSSGS